MTKSDGMLGLFIVLFLLFLGCLQQVEVKNEQDLEKLTDDLKGYNPLARNAALESIISAAQNEETRNFTYAFLSNALHDENLRMRESAVSALRGLAIRQDPDAIPLLEIALHDENDRIQHDAASYLAEAAKFPANKDAVISILVNALQDENPQVREKAAWALGKAAKNDANVSIALPYLANALFDEDAGVRGAAFCSFRDIEWYGQDISSVRSTLRGAYEQGFYEDTDADNSCIPTSAEGGGCGFFLLGFLSDRIDKRIKNKTPWPGLAPLRRQILATSQRYRTRVVGSTGRDANHYTTKAMRK